jgi:hypothetical protein
MRSDSIDQSPLGRGARCAFATYLASSTFAIVLTMLACGEGMPELLTCAGFAALAALLIRAYLDSAGLLEICVAEDDTPVACHPVLPAELRQADGLLRTSHAELEQLQEASRADPWRRREVRRQLAVWDAQKNDH